MKTLLAVLFSATVFGTPIQVTGFGTFAADNFFDTYANVCFSGDGVSVCANGVPIGPQPPTVLLGSTEKSPYMTDSDATVDGVTSNLYALSLGGDSGFIQTLDKTGNVMTSEEIAGVIQITSYQQSGTRWLAPGVLNDDWWARGTFTIGAAVPEADSGVLMGLGLLGVAIARRALGT